MTGTAKAVSRPSHCRAHPCGRPDSQYKTGKRCHMSVHTSSEQLTGTVLGNYRLEQLAEPHPWGPVFHAIDRAGKRYTVRFIVPDARRTPDERLIVLGRLQQE